MFLPLSTYFAKGCLMTRPSPLAAITSSIRSLMSFAVFPLYSTANSMRPVISLRQLCKFFFLNAVDLSRSDWPLRYKRSKTLTSQNLRFKTRQRTYNLQHGRGLCSFFDLSESDGVLYNYRITTKEIGKHTQCRCLQRSKGKVTFRYWIPHQHFAIKNDTMRGVDRLVRKHGIDTDSSILGSNALSMNGVKLPVPTCLP